MAKLNWNDLDKYADNLTDWFSLYELSVNEIVITQRQIDILLQQQNFFNPNKHKEDLQYLGKRLEDYERLRDISKEKVLEYDNE